MLVGILWVSSNFTHGWPEACTPLPYTYTETCILPCELTGWSSLNCSAVRGGKSRCHLEYCTVIQSTALVHLDVLLLFFFHKTVVSCYFSNCSESRTGVSATCCTEDNVDVRAECKDGTRSAKEIKPRCWQLRVWCVYSGFCRDHSEQCMYCQYEFILVLCVNLGWPG